MTAITQAGHFLSLSPVTGFRVVGGTIADDVTMVEWLPLGVGDGKVNNDVTKISMVEDGDTIVDWLKLGEVEKVTDNEAMIILEDGNVLGDWLGKTCWRNANT